MEGHITCVICPVGCRVSVKKSGREYSITGNKCPRGKGMPPTSKTRNAETNTYN